MSLWLKELPVSFTPLAKSKVLTIREAKGIEPTYGLRIGVKGGGGCGSGGMSYLLGFDKPKEGDDHFDLEGLPVFIDKRHTMYLIGMEIDFVVEDGVTGFTFVNPATTKS